MSRPRHALPRAKRALGQNFLINPGVRDKIIEALDPTPAHWAVEIGPGPGALTGPLTERCAHVVAVELDRALADGLPAVVPRPEVLEVRLEDGARLDYAGIARAAGRSLLLVGNLPFNAATAILRRALDQGIHLERLVLMFQREVALRLCAGPGTGEYGMLSVVTQQRARVTKLFDVSPGSFRPAPRVAATVVRFEPRRDMPPPCWLTVHDKVVRAAFSQRRKILRNSLRASAPWPWSQLESALKEVGIPPDHRAEAVPVAQWAALARRLCPVVGKMGA
jgi:16S rRNA (adenine1518-N6/adenine1519-N6)-dimethyltransferase